MDPAVVAEGVQVREQAELVEHPGPRQYVVVAVVLAAITAVEVAIFYMEALSFILVPALLALSAIKFSLVVLWFMHLKFDSPLFRRLFITGVILALFVFGVVLTIFFTRGGSSPGGDVGTTARGAVHSPSALGWSGHLRTS
jgi:cytochrome c oxidase subunit IV